MSGIDGLRLFARGTRSCIRHHPLVVRGPGHPFPRAHPQQRALRPRAPPLSHFPYATQPCQAPSNVREPPRWSACSVARARGGPHTPSAHCCTPSCRTGRVRDPLRPTLLPWCPAGNACSSQPSQHDIDHTRAGLPVRAAPQPLAGVWLSTRARGATQTHVHRPQCRSPHLRHPHMVGRERSDGPRHGQGWSWGRGRVGLGPEVECAGGCRDGAHAGRLGRRTCTPARERSTERWGVPDAHDARAAWSFRSSRWSPRATQRARPWGRCIFKSHVACARVLVRFYHFWSSRDIAYRNRG